MQEANITFEQPISECLRTCLRIEYLVQRIEANIAGESEIHSALALESILEILTVVDRPDLTSKITQILNQHASVLTLFEQKSHVDHNKLQVILRNIDTLTSGLYQLPDRIGQSLRENNFLNVIRQHKANPGGACPFAIPTYQLWLKQSYSARIQELKAWFSAFDPLKTAVDLVLQLTRDCSQQETCVAMQGFYQTALDPKQNMHLLRVTLPLNLQLYPEISVGRHRLVIRFSRLNVQDKSMSKVEEVSFVLACCLV